MYKGWKESFHNAWVGVFYGLRTQRNMQIHLCAAVVILLFSLLFPLTKGELLTLTFAVALVLISEMLNTAVEAVVDLSEKTNPLARTAKDIGAGAVLIAAFNALIVGYLILFPHLTAFFLGRGELRPSVPEEHLAFVTLLSVFLFTLFIKAYIGRGKALSGGMPSVHAALSFSIWTICMFTTEHILLSFLVLGMAIIICHSRMQQGIHDLKETIIGALIGVVLTIFFFKLFQ